MSEWLPLDSRELTEPVKRKFRGQYATVALSPHDIPQAVRSHKDADRLLIEFRYMGDPEPLRDVELGRSLLCKVGRHSGRLYQIELIYENVPTERAAENASLEEALGRFAGGETIWRLGENYKVAKRIVSSKQAQLFPQCVGA